MNTAILDISPGVRAIPVAAAHAEALASLVRANLDHLSAYLPLVATLDSAAAANAHLQRVADAPAPAALLEWHIFDGAQLCGSIRVHHIDYDDRKASLGYFLGQDCQGKGLASAAVRAALRHCFSVLELNRIELQSASANLASLRMAQRLGFVSEGVLRQAEWLNGAFVDLHVYGLLREEWQAWQASDHGPDMAK